MNDPNRTQMGAPPSVDPNRTIMGSAPTLNATVTIKPVQCPVCKSFNPPGVMFCNDCGLIFDRALDGDAFGAPAVQLPVLVGPDGREHQLRPGVNVVGRQGDVVAEDTRVSRRHCQLDLQGSVLIVQDLGSTNGTQVDGARLGPGESRTLPNGGRLSLGGYEMTLSLPGEQNRTLAAVSGRTAALTAPPTTSDAVAWLLIGDEEIPLNRGAHTFGRKADNAIVVPDAYVSGRHGLFEATDEGVYLTDTGSTNGTVLNDAKLNPDQRTQLQPGDVIRLGSTEIRIRFRG